MTIDAIPAGLRLVDVNLAATVEQASVGSDPYRIDTDGAPYVPVGDGGIVLGDGVWEHPGDHAAPGACLTHPDPAAGYALAAQACIGNPVTVRTGAAAGRAGVVIGKRGEGGRVIAEHRPGRPRGPAGHVRACDADRRGAGAAAEQAGRKRNRAAHTHVGPGPAAHPGQRPRPRRGRAAARRPGGDHRPGQPVQRGLPARLGHHRPRRARGSPQPGHGPGVTAILTGPAGSLLARADPTGHQGLSEEAALDAVRDLQ